MKKYSLLDKPLIGNRIVKTFNNIELELSSVGPEDVVNVAKKLKDREEIAHRRPITSYIKLLEELGKKWSNPNYGFRQEALEILPSITRQSKEMVEYELGLVSQVLNKRTLEGMVDNELGGKKYLDGWVNEGLVYNHRQPLGLIFHNLAGNAIIVPPLSLVYGLLTKNTNLLKVSSDEPYFGIRLVQSLKEIDKDVGEELSALYWPGSNQETYENLFRSSLINRGMHWGGEESRSSMAQVAAKYGVKLVEHGQKISWEVIESPRKKDVTRLAHDIISTDVVPWEQYACLSARLVFVKNGEVTANEFASELAKSMENVTKELPKGKTNAGQASSIVSNRQKYLLELELEGTGKLYESKGTDWTVVYSERKPTSQDINACVGRFIFVTPISSLNEVIDFIKKYNLKPYLQVLGYNGKDKGFMDAATYNGFSLITRPGQMGIHAPGSSHDGIYNLAELTNVVTHQKDLHSPRTFISYVSHKFLGL